MKQRLLSRLLLLVCLPGAFGSAWCGAARVELPAAEPPLNNPLKGLVPYAGAHGPQAFPHSLEFSYLPLSALVTGPERYDWTRLEALLNAVAGRGHQAVIRIYLEYPGKKDGPPAYLLEQGLTLHRYAENPKKPSAECATPDYANPHLRRCLTAFIAEFGRRYDGDPRLGFITAGLLGAWGEWHTHPREELFAAKDVQEEVLDAYAAAFKRTPVLLRYPAGGTHARHAANAARPFGYHDDSFAWATLETGRASDGWFYLALLRAAGSAAQEKWKTQPIGGEIRPEAWGKVFDTPPGDPHIQDFAACVEATHVSWLMDSGMFKRDVPADRRARAEAQVRRMGYVVQVAAVETASAAGDWQVKIELLNRGVAPFYADWPPELALQNAKGELVRTVAGTGTLRGLLPGAPARVWAERLPQNDLAPGTYTLLLRVPNPLPKGLPVRFANAAQDANRDGWLTLGTLTKP